MNTLSMMAIGRGGPYGRAMGVATMARDTAYRRCKDKKLRNVAAVLDEVETTLWNQGDDVRKLVAVAVTLAATLMLESPHLAPDRLGAASDKLIQAIIVAAQDAETYHREHHSHLLAAHRAVYSDIYAQCTDSSRRSAARAVLRGAVLGKTLAYRDPSRVDIDAIKMAIAALKGDDQV
ncbi:hypothetical protein [Burkholderia territorii]|uniref:hypothetical protein n=1 Tax=Burkholderia territorii TaxID=1503055 RepID=UPI0007B9587D|nr:hypothetical protein [Burkholderia territorii]